jgi:hypothetical protein
VRYIVFETRGLRHAMPSLVAFVLQGVSLQLVSARSRCAKLLFCIFMFNFCSKMVLVVTFGVIIEER